MGHISLKVFKGTRSVDAPRLCDTCRSGIVMRGPAEGEEGVHCAWLRRAITMRVTECNRYVDRCQPELDEMRRIAWVLDPSRKGQRVGFLPASEWQQRNPHEDLIPDQ